MMQLVVSVPQVIIVPKVHQHQSNVLPVLMSLELALTSVKHALLGIIAQRGAHKLSSALMVTAPRDQPHQLCALMELILTALY
jgi:hypothetical protein